MTHSVETPHRPVPNRPVPRRTVTGPFIERLRAIVGDDGMLSEASDLLVYECDGYVVEKNIPDVVLLPTTRDQVVAIVKACNEFDVPFVPRGAGTSLSGGCLPVGGGVMITLTRMKRILEVNLRDRYAVVEPGLVNVHLTQRLKGTGYHYAPILRARGRARSAATSRRIPAARTRSNMA